MNRRFGHDVIVLLLGTLLGLGSSLITAKYMSAHDVRLAHRQTAVSQLNLLRDSAVKCLQDVWDEVNFSEFDRVYTVSMPYQGDAVREAARNLYRTIESRRGAKRDMRAACVSQDLIHAYVAMTNAITDQTDS